MITRHGNCIHHNGIVASLTKESAPKSLQIRKYCTPFCQIANTEQLFCRSDGLYRCECETTDKRNSRTSQHTFRSGSNRFTFHAPFDFSFLVRRRHWWAQTALKSRGWSFVCLPPTLLHRVHRNHAVALSTGGLKPASLSSAFWS